MGRNRNDDGLADRAAGVLLGTAVGDALGVHYEFGTPPHALEKAEMLGGGLGNFDPGEWSDDTSMAVVIAEAISCGGDATSESTLDKIADGFVRWMRSDPPDAGTQTAAVLTQVMRRLDDDESGVSRICLEEALIYSLSHPHSAGNGALMRTAPVALAHLHDRDRLARAARQVAQLTHADPLAGDSCVLWCEAVRVAVLERRIDIAAGLDLLPARHDQWSSWVEEAIRPDDHGGIPGRRFSPNGYTVTAFQAAAAAVTHGEAYPNPFEEGLHAAVRIGDDTDTVAAIAGALLGACHGARAVPKDWVSKVHGWPGLDALSLVALASTH